MTWEIWRKICLFLALPFKFSWISSLPQMSSRASVSPSLQGSLVLSGTHWLPEGTVRKETLIFVLMHCHTSLSTQSYGFSSSTKKQCPSLYSFINTFKAHITSVQLPPHTLWHTPYSYTFFWAQFEYVVIWLICSRRVCGHVVDFQFLPEDFFHLIEEFKLSPTFVKKTHSYNQNSNYSFYANYCKRQRASLCSVEFFLEIFWDCHDFTWTFTRDRVKCKNFKSKTNTKTNKHLNRFRISENQNLVVTDFSWRKPYLRRLMRV